MSDRIEPGGENRGPDPRIILSQPFSLVSSDLTSDIGTPLDADNPDLGEKVRLITHLSLSLRPSVERGRAKAADVRISLEFLTPDQIANLPPPITPLDDDSTYVFDSKDYSASERSVKLQGYSQERKKKAFEDNPLGLSISIALNKAGIMVRDPDIKRSEIEEITYVAAKGFENITTIDVVVETPQGTFIAHPDLPSLYHYGILIYSSFSPIGKSIDGSFVLSQETLFPAGNPMTFPDIKTGGIKRLGQMKARFLESPVYKPLFKS